jgi:hypothetical protein
MAEGAGWISIRKPYGSPRRSTTPGDACRGFEGKARLFFSEEKKQKTFMSGARGKIPAHSLSVGASIVGVAEK